MPATVEANRALLDKILTGFQEYLNTPEAKALLEKMNSEKEEVKALVGRLSKLDRNSPEFVEWVLYGLLPYSKSKYAKRVSLFPAFMNIKPFFKRHNYSEEDWRIIANKIFELCLNFQKRPEDLDVLIQTFSRDKYSKNLQCGSITPILFCLNDKFPLVNRPVRHAYKSIMRMLGQKDKLSQKLRDYPTNIAKLDRLVEELGLGLLENRDYLDMFWWWYDRNIVQPLKAQKQKESDEDEEAAGTEEEKQIQDINAAEFIRDVDLTVSARLTTHKLKNPDTVRVRDIVTKAHENKWLLPRFQRYFDWNKQDIRDFIESIFFDQYVGAILLWEMEGEPPLDVMAIEGVQRDEEAKIEALILDGQQRITSLYYAIKAPDIRVKGSSTPVYFYVNFATFLQGDGSEEIVEVHARKLTREQSYERLLFPMYELGASSEWVNGLEDYLLNKLPDAKKLRDLRRLIDNKLKHVWDGFEIPYVQLPSSMDIGLVTDTFEKLNTRGKRLSVFDLLIARLHKYDLDLRSLWDATLKQYQNIARYYRATEKIPIYVLQAISLCHEKNSSCKTRDILNIYDNIYSNPAYEFEKHWEEFSDYLNRAIEKLENLRDGFGVKNEKELPFDPMIPILAALLKEIESREKKADCHRKLSMWYWSSVFTNAYSSAVDSQMTADFKEMRDWFRDDTKVPKTVNQMRTEFSILSFRDIQKKSNAKYRGVMSLIALEGARDFDTGLNLENARGNDRDHLFPRAELAFGQGRFVNSVLNMTWMSEATNRRIKQAKRPSVYVPEFVQEKYRNSEEEFSSVLATHFIRMSTLQRLKEDDFEGFLQDREGLILAKIRELIGLEGDAAKPSLILPEQPFTNKLAFLGVIRSCDKYVHWADKYFSSKGLEWLVEAIDAGKVKEVKVLMASEKVSAALRDAFKDFREEMAHKGVQCELRVLLDTKLKAQIHDRWIISGSECFNIPSPDVVARGQFSEIKATANRPPFLEWWQKGVDIILGWNQIQPALKQA